MFLFSLIVHSVNGKKITAQESDVSTQSLCLCVASQQISVCGSGAILLCNYNQFFFVPFLCSIVCGLSGSAAFFIN